MPKTSLDYSQKDRSFRIVLSNGTILLGPDGSPVLWTHKDIASKGARQCAVEAQRIILTMEILEGLE